MHILMNSKEYYKEEQLIITVNNLINNEINEILKEEYHFELFIN